MRRLLIPLLLLALSTAADAAEPKITGLKATAARQKISVSFDLAGGFDQPAVIKALQSGIPTGFTYSLEVIRKRPNWFDTELARARIEVICTFNSLTNEYLINYRRNRRLVRSEVVSSVAEVQKRMSSIDERELFQISERPYKLRVRVRAEVIRDYIFYVVPWDVGTEWAETRVEAEQSP